MYVKETLKKIVKEIPLSVIIPIYNAQKEIGYLLEDIQKQTYINFEVIMIDDGSSDQSGMICQAVSAEDQRFTYIYQDNGGVSSARNHGLKEARGKYISFLDADDRIPKDRFEKMINIVEQKDGDLVIGHYIITMKDGQFPYSKWQSDLKGEQTVEALIKDYAKSMSGFYYGVIWNKLYKQRIIAEYKIQFDESMSWGEDLLFNLQYFSRISNCIYLSENIYEYCYTENSLLSDHHIYQEEIDIIRYKNIVQLGSILSEKDYKVYKKYANIFLLESVIRQMSKKTSGVGFRDKAAYQSFVKYLSLPEISFLWKEELFRNNGIYYLMQKFISKKYYRLIYTLFVLKGRINQNRLWDYIKKIVLKNEM